MIRIVNPDMDDGYNAQRKYLKCPHCENVIRFYSNYVRPCDSCKKELGFDVRGLLKNPKERMAYHVANS